MSKSDKADFNKLNSISKKSNIIFNVILSVYCVFCLIPLLLIISASLSDEKMLAINGYQFIPQKITTFAYQYIITNTPQVVTAYGITILVTVVGTVLGVLVMALYAFPISRSDFKYKNFFTFYLVFTMLFNGGMVSTYLIGVNVLHFKDNIWGLIIPYMMNAFWVIILRTFYKTNIPDSIIESAKIDGASEFRILGSIIFPLCVPVLATILLFAAVDQWNAWFDTMLFCPGAQELTTLQYELQKVLQTAQQMRTVDFSQALTNNNATITPTSIRAAMTIIVTVPIALVYPFLQKYFIKGLTIGSVKG